MYLRLIIVSSVFFTCIDASAKKCDDCIKISSCEVAINLLRDNKNDTTILHNEFCGFEGMVPKVCCSELSLSNYFSQIMREENREKLKFLPHNCGENGPGYVNERRLTRLYEFPWLALIARKGHGGGFHCEGSILNDKYVLTAAHCVKRVGVTGVRVGEHDLMGPIDCQQYRSSISCETHIQDLDVEEIVIHEGFQTAPSIKNDIALIRLKQTIDFDHKNVAPICLPFKPHQRNIDLDGVIGTAAGWDLILSETTVKLRDDKPVLSKADCIGFYNREHVEDGHFCTKDPLTGGSGRPFVVKGNDKNNTYVQYGVMSHGPKVFDPSKAIVYTDVRKHIDWILSKMRE